MSGKTLHALFFLSGFAALVYEVLWLRELSLLFGSTAAATATTLAIFFGGIALGSEIWGRRSVHVAVPLRAYAWLEIGVAVCALGHFVLIDADHALYAPLFQALLERP
jgi:spermidine synthase